MTSIFLITTISCAQAMGVLNRLTSVVGLTERQKNEIVVELKKIIPSCPITIKPNEYRKK
jgi:hypothetical protein